MWETETQMEPITSNNRSLQHLDSAIPILAPQYSSVDSAIPILAPQYSSGIFFTMFVKGKLDFYNRFWNQIECQEEAEVVNSTFDQQLMEPITWTQICHG